jgi:hypothetical protein
LDTRNLSRECVAQVGATWATEFVTPLLASGKSLINTALAVPSRVPYWQRTFGDYLGEFADGYTRSLEVKTERRHTGNLYLETWSNRTTNNEWRRDGWMFTLQTDLIAFVFLDAEVGYLMSFSKLKDWAITEGKMYKFPERTPALSLEGGQMNNTVGHVVPIADVCADMRVAEYRRNASSGVWTRVSQNAEVCK